MLEFWTIIIRLRMVWILPGDKVTEGGGDTVVGRLGSATNTGPSFPGKVNYMPPYPANLSRHGITYTNAHSSLLLVETEVLATAEVRTLGCLYDCLASDRTREIQHVAQRVKRSRKQEMTPSKPRSQNGGI